MKYLSVLLLITVFYTNTNAQKPEERAFLFMENKNYTAAQQIYDSLLYKKPAKIEYLYLSAICDFELKQENSAIDKFGKVLNSIPSESRTDDQALQVKLMMAKAYHNIYLFDKAVSIYDEILETGKTSISGEDIKTLKQNAKNAKELMQDFKQIMVTKLSIINSEFDDHTPIPAEGGNIIFFTSKRKGGTGNKLSPEGKYYEDIYVWNKNLGLRSKPYNIGPPINTEMHEATAGVSHDGKTLFIYKANKKTAGDLYISTLEDTVWSEPQVLGKTINKRNNRQQHAALSADGNTLYFSSNYRKGKGGYDIWISQKQEDGSWGEPINASFNTEHDEGAPFIMQGDKTLFFSSKGYKGMGGYDVFKTVKSADNTWSDPENIGFPLNTTGDDIFYFPAGNENIAYFTRRDGGSSNIYKAQLYGEQEEYLIVKGTVKENESEFKNYRIIKEVKDTVFCEGKVFMAGMSHLVYKDSVYNISFEDSLVKTEKYTVPHDAQINVWNMDNKAYSDVYKTNSDAGDYQFLLLPDKGYKIVYENEGLLFDTKDIKTHNNKSVISYDAVLHDVNKANLRKTKLLSFRNNEAIIDRFGKAEMELTEEYLNKYPQLMIDFSGPKYKEAKIETSNGPIQLKDYLTEKGISENRIYTQLSTDSIAENRLQYTLFNQVLLADLEDEKKLIQDSIEAEEEEEEEEKDILHIEIENVYFAFEGSKLNKPETTDRLAEYLKNNPQAKIIILGYTDGVGSEVYNKKLSRRRAEHVQNLLINGGALKEQTEILACGENNPISFNLISGQWKEASKKYNRRVEFRVIRQGKKPIRIIQMQNIPDEYKNPDYDPSYEG
jgi:outer membrane protein OmpA-like peptidoglycan-associated protein